MENVILFLTGLYIGYMIARVSKAHENVVTLEITQEEEEEYGE